ncbi:RHS repeat-associated core domain-containing protein [Actinoplanes sp. G11-F43]|uniref:TreTu family toxin n=1 Tax=Actinoplanes sp. G11-F43 TaxID=3424130 RepID=UPI003D351EC4
MFTRSRSVLSLRWSRLFVGSLVSAVVMSGLTVPASAAVPSAPVVEPPKPPVEKLDEDGGPVTARAWAQKKVRDIPAATPVWPKASTVTIDLSAAGPASLRSATATRSARVGDLPVWIADAPEATGGSPLSRLNVRVVDRAAVPAAMRDGMLLQVTAPQGAATGKARLSVDYRGFQDAYGADWSSRLKLWQVPSCALSTPKPDGCSSTPLASTVDADAGTVSATVAVDSTGTAPSSAAAARGSFVALAASPSGDSGDFTATSLTPSASWSAGGNSGEFSWNYPMRVPPATGLTPNVELAYSSASVDGRSEVTNNQPSWIGEGFDYSPGYIERSYVPCFQDSEEKTKPNSTKSSGDLCWRSDNATVSLGGSSSELIYQAGKGWHYRSENGAKVEKLTGAANGDTGTAGIDGVGEHWRITTTDGTQYYFGLDDLPGQTTATNSTLTVPVFGNHKGEPCHQDEFMSSDCVQAYRWNLDYVVSARGNTMSYWYDKETNKYAQNAKESSVVTYDRAGYLKRIDYGTYDRTTSGHGVTERNTTPYAQVVFTPDIRCFTDCGTTSEPTTKNWKDTPWDQECKASATSCPDQFSPTFWTTKRLKTVTTRVWDTTVTPAAWQNVDSWALTHTFSATADTTHTGLWLEKIDHAGLVGGTVNLPPVTFEAESLPNRVLTDNTSTHNWLRISSIVTETGSRIKVDYSAPDCTAAIIATLKAHSNTRRCYPVKVPSNADPGGDVMVEEWWHKYVVTHIAEDDLQTSNDHPAPSRHTRYEYVDAPAWHYAEDDGLIPTNRKTWSQWRGYGEVRTTTGDEADTRTLTVTKFLRGMHGDRATPTGGVRSVTVPATVGSETVNDHDQFAGQVREQTTFNGVDTKPVSKVVKVPWRSNPLASRTVVDDNGYADTAEARYVDTQVIYTATALGVDGSRGWRTSATRAEFDQTYGTADWTQNDGDITTTGDETCTTYTYNRNTAKNLTQMVSRALTTALSCGKAPASADDVISDTRSYYDNATSVTTPLKYGMVTKTEQLKDWTPSTGTQWQTTSEATYDSAGRVQADTDIKKNVTATTYTPAVGGPLTKTTTKNALGWTSTVETNPYWGSVTKMTDPNGRPTVDVDYDALGRVARVWELGWSRANNTTKPSAQYEYKFAANRDAYPYLKSQKLNAAGNYVTSYEISDSLLRPRQTQTLSLGGSGDRVVTDTIYDEFGRTVTTYGAHAEPGTPSGVLWWEPDWSVPSITKTVYDRASRPTASIFYSGDGVTNLVEKWRTTTAYEGDLTKTTPPEGGTPTTTLTDIQGRTIALRQHTTPAGVNGAYTQTRYAFNRKGQQTTVTDSDGNEWGNTYDLRGRLASTEDPDKGTTEYGYNEFGELETTKDARGEVLWYGYDTIGRKKQLRDDGKGGPLRAAWTYDALTDGSTGFRGQLTQSIRYEPAGSANAYRWQVSNFSSRYQPTAVNYVIPAVETGLNSTYSYGYGYAGATGEPTTVSFPAGGGLVTEQLTTTYNATTGMPERLNTSLTGWAGTMANTYYTAYGERSGSVYQLPTAPFVGDNVYRDEGTRRITRTTVERKSVAGTVSDRNYEYDKAGNILSIEEKPAVGSADKQCFRTDPLGRLTTAWTPKVTAACTADPAPDALAGPAPYWQDWTFTDTGSRKTETTRTPTGTTARDYTVPAGGKNVIRPHAVTAMNTTIGATTDTTEYRYDDSGNMICRPTVGSTTNTCATGIRSQTLNWDAEGELATVTDGTNTIEASVYDANGERLIRRDATGTTLYLPGQEIRREGTTNTGTRYYSFAGTTFASRTGSSDITSLNWLFNDHQGTQQLTINAGTQAVTARRQTPYGGERGTNPMWVNKKSFVGGDQDTTGLINIGARRYDVLLGRFISVDPIMDLADPQQWNGYNYANNGPITRSDPTGLLLHCDIPAHCNINKSPDKGDDDGGKGPTKPPKEGGGGGPGGGGGGNGGSGDIGNEPVKVSEPLKEAMTGGGYHYDGDFTVNDVAKFLSESTANWDLWCAHSAGMEAEDCKRENPFANKLSAEASILIVAAVFAAPVVVAACIAGCTAAVAGIVSGELALASSGTLVASSAATTAAVAGVKVAVMGGKAGLKWLRPLAGAACSFSGDTAVLLADGTTKPLSEVEVGDEVLATDPETGEQGPRKVEKVWVHNDDLYVLDVDGRRLTVTEDHPFWNETDKRWEGPEELELGDLLRTVGGTVSAGTFNWDDHRYAPAYNLTVAGIHTYYVLAGNTPVLVHNDGGDDVARVGRWMSQAEYDAMVRTGMVQRGGGGLTYVVHPADPEAYRSARPGSVYAEFDVPRSSLIPGGRPGDFKMSDSSTVFSRLAVSKGGAPLELPAAKNITLGGGAGC